MYSRTGLQMATSRAFLALSCLVLLGKMVHVSCCVRCLNSSIGQPAGPIATAAAILAPTQILPVSQIPYYWCPQHKWPCAQIKICLTITSHHTHLIPLAIEMAISQATATGHWSLPPPRVMFPSPTGAVTVDGCSSGAYKDPKDAKTYVSWR